MKKAEKELLRKYSDMLDDIAQAIRCSADNEQDRYDNWSERTQESERGELLEEKIDNLNSAADAIEEAISMLEDALDSEV